MTLPPLGVGLTVWLMVQLTNVRFAVPFGGAVFQAAAPFPVLSVRVQLVRVTVVAFMAPWL